MPKSKPYARIAITLPPRDLSAADRLAREHGRSRSWIIAEAIRRYAAARESSTGGTTPSRSGLGTQRLDQLTRDMALTPEARVREADETLRLTRTREPARVQLLAFDRLEQYLDWKRRRDYDP
ncbi:MAG: ribbon-helix-helix domain-containing protein [Gemmatimonadaceae bacterium]